MIYVVEDDSGIRELVIYTLQQTGFSAQGFENASNLSEAISKRTPRMILLDIMLPDEDGISVLRRLRQNASTKNIPIIMMTAKGTEHDKVIGLDNGADDYITKPFGMMELIARIKAVLRRTESDSEEVYICRDVRLDAAAHTITVSGKQIETTFKEFELLKLLMKKAGTVLSRDTILGTIWGYDFYGETRTVDVHIKTLRTKLGSSGDIIETIRGVGYKIGGKE